MTDTTQMPEAWKALEKDLLAESPEVCLWMTVRGGLTLLKEIEFEYREKKLDQRGYTKKMNAALVDLAWVIGMLHRFSVVLPCHLLNPRHLDREEQFVTFTFYPIFWRWYNWWGDYLISLDQPERDLLFRLVTNRSGKVDRFYPPGDWLHHRSDPFVTLVVT